MLDPVSSLQHRPIRTLNSMFHEGLHTLYELLIVALLILGITGFMLKAFGADGLVPRLLHTAWESGPSYLIFAVIGMVVGAAWLKRLFYRRPAIIGRSGDLLVFSFLAMGTFFGLRLMITGAM
ncbi:MAG: hypothetical protein GTO41_22885 [Burkholderiales bacterium]|nr:hypothetical protein [Burkholderiales bacterium]